MPIYRMAGVYVKIEPKYNRLREYAEKYLYTGESEPENVVDLSFPEGFLEEKRKQTPHLSLEDCEYMWTGGYFSTKLIEHSGFVLHSSAVAYKGEAYIFSANSGTGKSTHTRFWKKVFGEDNAVIINDDKPALREIDGTFYACGTAFSGKSPTSEDIQVPIKAVCFIYRAEENAIRRLETAEALKLIFEQTVKSGKEKTAGLLLEVLDSFLKKVPCYSLGVTYSEKSAEFVYNALNNKAD